MQKPLRRLSPAGVLLGSFGTAILVGAVALRLPVMHTGGSVSFLDCLFTSTSAVCVTGLISVDTAKVWSSWGLAVIALLIQAGGLGIMTLSVAMLHLAGKKPSLRSHLALRGALGPVPGQEMGRLTRDVIIYTLCIEAVGAALLYLRFSQDFGHAQSLALAAFHSVSAFCNAGFSMFSNNLEGYPRDPLINLTIMALIVMGGIGFVVLRELRGRYLRRLRGGPPPRLSLHTRIVLSTTAVLIVAGVAALYLLEYLSDGGQVWRGSIWPLLFTAITPRTAGFNTIPMADLSNGSLLLIITLMFIGASPGSTGGGVKTTTLATLLAMLRNRLRGRPGATLGKRAIPPTQVGEALTLVLGSMLVLTLALVMMVSMGGEALGHSRDAVLSFAFEAVSAFGTVGLSMGVTDQMTAPNKLVLICLMFIGRLGPLTLIYSLAAKYSQPRFQLAEERIMLG